MYESFFGFEQRPFLSIPTLDRYFPASSVEQAYQTTSRAIERCEGPVAVFGGVGLGKTMCCLRIAESVSKRYEVVMLASSQIITRRALLQSLLHALGLPFRGLNEGELRLTLLERLQPSEEHCRDGLVLVVDEAQTLSIKLLEELRLLTNIVSKGIPRVRLVLSGTMKLEESLSHPHMESLNQRLAARCYLLPLSHDETKRYLQHKIELSGVGIEEAMTTDAMEAVYRATDGIPRLVDQVADQALLLGAQEKTRPISASLVGAAWSILQQLPNPWSEPTLRGHAPTSPSASVEFYEDEQEPWDWPPSPTASQVDAPIEFGELEDLENQPWSSDETSTLEVANGEIPRGTQFFSESWADPETDLAADRAEDSVAARANFLDSTPAPAPGPDPAPAVEENFFRAFEEGFDEEFSVPVQSLDNFETLSGIALGDLNHDLHPSMEIPQLPAAGIPEAAAFLEIPETQTGPVLGPARELSSAEFSGWEAELRSVEQEIESEMRELVADANLSAMTVEVEESLALGSNCLDTCGSQVEVDGEFATVTPSRAGPGIASNLFAALRDTSLSEEMGRDDSDILSIEEEVDSLKETLAQETQPTVRASLHPYAQLFTRLRKS